MGLPRPALRRGTGNGRRSNTYGILSVKMLEWSLLYGKGKEAEIVATTIQTIVRDGKGYETNAFKTLVARIAEKGAIQDVSVIGSSGAPVFVVGKGLVGSGDDGKSLYLIGGLDIKMTGAGWFEGVGRDFWYRSADRFRWDGHFSMPLGI